MPKFLKKLKQYRGDTGEVISWLHPDGIMVAYTEPGTYWSNSGFLYKQTNKKISDEMSRHIYKILPHNKEPRHTAWESLF